MPVDIINIKETLPINVDKQLSQKELATIKKYYNLYKIEQGKSSNINYEIASLIENTFGIGANFIKDLKSKSQEEIALFQLYFNIKYNQSIVIDGIFGRQVERAITSINTNNYNNKPKPGIANGNKTNKKETAESPEYTLSKDDFEKHFSGKNFQQGLVGNCRLLSVIDGFRKNTLFEKIIRKSVSISNDGNGDKFNIKLPLCENSQKSYIVTDENLQSQISIEGLPLSLIDTENKGLYALIYAYGIKSSNGNPIIDFQKLSGGTEAEAIKELIGKTYIYDETYNNGSIIRKVVKDISGYKGRLKKVLNIFDPKKHILTIGVDQGKEIASINKIGYLGSSSHAVSISEVVKDLEGKIVHIKISNPWNTGMPFEIKYPDCLDYLNSYTLSSFERISGLSETEISNSEKSRNGKSEINGSTDSLNEIIQLSGKINSEQQISRGDVVVTKKDGKVSIKSRGKNDTYISYEELLTTITINNKILTLNSEVFSNSFNGETSNMYTKYLYPPRLSVFINKMRHDYIDQKKGDKTNKNPFGIYEGMLVFDDEYSTTSTKRQVAEFFTNDDTVTVLNDRSLLGIQKNANNTKQKIVDFLNLLYNS